MTTAPGAAATPVLYVVTRFQRLSETFTLQEMLRLMAQGVPVASHHALDAHDAHDAHDWTSPAADILAVASPHLLLPLA